MLTEAQKVDSDVNNTVTMPVDMLELNKTLSLFIIAELINKEAKEKKNNNNKKNLLRRMCL